ncbi:MAG: hypothetical protein K2L76_06785 [Muribaculaceae bacterium]|nr:hypothetical protein [Muribaculaceae bacterium]
MSSMAYSYFPGGYFDADGAPHFLHTDYQGSVVMVTDSAGCVEQHTAYYFKTLYDKTDEDEAYNRGKLFGQVNEANSSIYNSLQDGPCSIPEVIKNDGAKLIEFAQRNQCAFRWAGKTYTPAGIK